MKSAYPITFTHPCGVNFWCQAPLVQLLHISPLWAGFLSGKVCDFIKEGWWEIPVSIQMLFPNLANIVLQITLPIHHTTDQRRWKHSKNGELSMKDAFSFKSPHSQHVDWAKSIWGTDIPTSKSLLAWRLMHNKVPTGEQLCLRGFSFPSMCGCVYSTLYRHNLCSFVLQIKPNSYHTFLQSLQSDKEEMRG